MRPQADLGALLLLLCVLLVLLAVGTTGARHLPRHETGATHLPRHKGAVKTIKTDYGDIIDCVDVYKQPSLERLSSKNRTIQIFPNQYPSSTDNHPSKTPQINFVKQRWQRSGTCPQGTIPILRRRRTPLRVVREDDTAGKVATVERALAYASPDDGPFHGARARLQGWAMHVEPNEYSMTSITLLSATNKHIPPSSFADLNITDFVRAGLMAYPNYFGDDWTRLFVQWSNDNGVSTGCFNLDCAGFVQTNSDIALGADFEPLSVYDDPQHQYVTIVKFRRDLTYHRWYVDINNAELGFWPMDGLFQDLYEAPWVTWGGAILNTWPGGEHTGTHMGNGHRAEEGVYRAAMIQDLTIIASYDVVYEYMPSFFQDRQGCYDTAYLGSTPEGDGGPYFSYGGPGGPGC